MGEPRRFKVYDEQGITVLHLVDPQLFDTLMVNELEDELLEFIDANQPKKVLVDFEGVTHCSTAVINGLIRAKKRLMGYQAQLGLCGMAEQIRKAYKLLNLDGTVFHIYEDRKHGLAAMQLEQ